MSPERVSVGEEGEGHFTYRDRRQKRAQRSTFGLADGFTTFVCGVYMGWHSQTHSCGCGLWTPSCDLVPHN